VELKNTLHKLAPAISLLLFTLAIFVVYREIEIYRWQDIRRVLQDFPASLMVTCGVITLLSYVVLSFYDYLALEYAGEKTALPSRAVHVFPELCHQQQRRPCMAFWRLDALPPLFRMNKIAHASCWIKITSFPLKRKAAIIFPGIMKSWQTLFSVTPGSFESFGTWWRGGD